MSKRKKEIKPYGLLKLLTFFLLCVVIIYSSFHIVDSLFWKKWVSPRFSGGNLTESFLSNRPDLIEGVEYINPTVYRIKLNDAKRGEIISLYDDYDAYWYAKEIGIESDGVIISSPHRSNINNFRLRYGGDYTLEVFYARKRWMEIVVISLLLSFSGIFILSFIHFKGRVKV